MIIICFLSFISLSFSRTVDINTRYRKIRLEGTEVTIKPISSDYVEQSGFTDESGNISFDIDYDEAVISAKLDNFKTKGHVGQVEEKVVLEMSPKKGSIQGRVIVDGKVLEGKRVYLKNFFVNEIRETTSDKRGIFTFNSVPIGQKHILLILPEDSTFLFYQELHLSNENGYFLETYLQPKSLILNIRIKDHDKNIGYIVVNKKSVELDENGLAQVLITLDTPKIEIIYNKERHVREVDSPFIISGNESIEDLFNLLSKRGDRGERATYYMNVSI